MSKRKWVLPIKITEKKDNNIIYDEVEYPIYDDAGMFIGVVKKECNIRLISNTRDIDYNRARKLE